MTSTLRDQVVDQARLFVHLLSVLGDDDRLELTLAHADLAERCFQGLEALHEAVLDLDETVIPDDVTIRDPDAKRRAYLDLVDRFRARLAGELPPGAVVAVASRGDPSLVDLPGLTGWHYPQDELGVYAGFHPATGRDAVDQLIGVCRKGARYLAIPATSSWWLDFYEELRDHLTTRAHLVLADGDLSLYELVDDGAPPALEPAAARYHHQVQQFIELADALLPAGSVMLVVSRGDDALVATRRSRARHFPSDHGGEYAGHPRDSDHAIAMLADQVIAGASYLAMPAPLRWWSTAYPSFDAHLRSAHRCLADHNEVGVVFELLPPTNG